MSIENLREEAARRAVVAQLPVSLRGKVGSDRRLAVAISSVDELPLEDLAVAVSRGVALVLQPTSGPFDLEALSPVLRLTRSLKVSGWQAATFYTGWQVLEDCTSLEDLDLLHDPAIPVNLADLPSLRVLEVAGPNSMSGVSNPHLEILSISGEFDASLRLPTALRSLDIEGTQAVDLSVLPNASRLERLGVRHSPRFDVAALLAAPNLKDLRFDKVAVIENAPLFNRLTHLELLFLYGVKSIEGHEALADSTIDTLWVGGGSRAFSDEFRARVKNRPGWDIPAPRRVPRPAEGGGPLRAG